MDRSKRHSSLEPSEVQHMESSLGGVYALVNKFPPKKSSNREVSDLLSSTVRAQLPLDATEQIQGWGEGSHEENGLITDPHKPENGKERKDLRKAGYIQLDFHTAENGAVKGKIASESSPIASSRVDTGKTKFGYSTVVFEKEQSKDAMAEKKRHKPPQPPPKYEGSGPLLSKNASDSQLLYSDIDHSKMHASLHGSSSPDITQYALIGTTDEGGYVNVRHNHSNHSNTPPSVPPRRGVAAIPKSPELPLRKTS